MDILKKEDSEEKKEQKLESTLTKDFNNYRINKKILKKKRVRQKLISSNDVGVLMDKNHNERQIVKANVKNKKQKKSNNTNTSKILTRDVSDVVNRSLDVLANGNDDLESETAAMLVRGTRTAVKSARISKNVILKSANKTTKGVLFVAGGIKKAGNRIYTVQKKKKKKKSQDLKKNINTNNQKLGSTKKNEVNEKVTEKKREILSNKKKETKRTILTRKGPDNSGRKILTNEKFKNGVATSSRMLNTTVAMSTAMFNGDDAGSELIRKSKSTIEMTSTGGRIIKNTASKTSKGINHIRTRRKEKILRKKSKLARNKAKKIIPKKPPSGSTKIIGIICGGILPIVLGICVIICVLCLFLAGKSPQKVMWTCVSNQCLHCYDLLKDEIDLYADGSIDIHYGVYGREDLIEEFLKFEHTGDWWNESIEIKAEEAGKKKVARKIAMFSPELLYNTVCSVCCAYFEQDLQEACDNGDLYAMSSTLSRELLCVQGTNYFYYCDGGDTCTNYKTAYCKTDEDRDFSYDENGYHVLSSLPSTGGVSYAILCHDHMRIIGGEKCTSTMNFGSLCPWCIKEPHTEEQVRNGECSRYEHIECTYTENEHHQNICDFHGTPKGSCPYDIRNFYGKPKYDLTNAKYKYSISGGACNCGDYEYCDTSQPNWYSYCSNHTNVGSPSDFKCFGHPVCKGHVVYGGYHRCKGHDKCMGHYYCSGYHVCQGHDCKALYIYSNGLEKIKEKVDADESIAENMDIYMDQQHFEWCNVMYQTNFEEITGINLKDYENVFPGKVTVPIFDYNTEGKFWGYNLIDEDGNETITGVNMDYKRYTAPFTRTLLSNLARYYCSAGGTVQNRNHIRFMQNGSATAGWDVFWTNKSGGLDSAGFVDWIYKTAFAKYGNDDDFYYADVLTGGEYYINQHCACLNFRYTSTINEEDSTPIYENLEILDEDDWIRKPHIGDIGATGLFFQNQPVVFGIYVGEDDQGRRKWATINSQKGSYIYTENDEDKPLFKYFYGLPFSYRL